MNFCSAPNVAELLTIARMGQRGDGIADTPAGLVYVPFTLPGEVVSAERIARHPDRRQLVTVDEPSPDRVAPISPYFGICGGCALQHWALGRQQEWKRQRLIETLAKLGLQAEVTPTIDAHGEGRRRIVLHARRRGDVLEVGFAAARSHQIVAIDRCPILASSMSGAIPAAWTVAEAIDSNRPLDIQVTATDAGLDIDVRGSGQLSATQMAAVATLAGANGLARVTRHGELVTQRAQPVVTMGSAQVPLPPGAFLQATVAGEETLARLVLEHIGSAKTVADLFCGVGPFALRLARIARITAADNDRPALDALDRAAASTSGLKPIATHQRDLFRHPFTATELKSFAAVVFDPPRQGAEAQAHELAKSAVPIVVAVSCDAETFARDAKILAGGGYRPEAVTPIDQFRYSPHVEIVAKFVR